MENSHSHSSDLPNWVLVATFVFFLFILWYFTDTFTAVLGTILEGVVFAVAYDAEHEH
ncbi:hypothetical protein SAMN04515674_11933 [Pseudarcicella hirudinis]|uniref:Uncharacterized protein n=1 Tax=Pseudarcicella hirudinis TaxID=1079859 RepID=A0A1I5YJ64_9BACT|nr:hypothetical protein [Pseudarcicella hirudinis]SFQ44228.1 hypothetical protein SAMN04515674_11933 [Pseudarcicella hirudinis]